MFDTDTNEAIDGIYENKTDNKRSQITKAAKAKNRINKTITEVILNV